MSQSHDIHIHPENTIQREDYTSSGWTAIRFVGADNGRTVLYLHGEAVDTFDTAVCDAPPPARPNHAALIANLKNIQQVHSIHLNTVHVINLAIEALS